MGKRYVSFLTQNPEGMKDCPLFSVRFLAQFHILLPKTPSGDHRAMTAAENERLRWALRTAKTALLEPIALLHPVRSGDQVELRNLREVYGQISVLLQELEAGNWEGRTVENRHGRSV